MANYKQMYFTLLNATTEAIDHIDEASYSTARAILIEALQKAEEIYIETAEEAD